MVKKDPVIVQAKNRIGRFVIPNLPKIFIVALLVSYPLFFSLIDTSYERISRLVVFIGYAIAVTCIFFGKAILCSRAENGKPSLWLTVSTYAFGGFSITMWGIVLLYLSTYYFPNIESAPFYRSIGFALVGGGMTGEFIAAMVMIWGLKDKKRLGTGIHPLPWRKRKRDK